MNGAVSLRWASLPHTLIDPSWNTPKRQESNLRPNNYEQDSSFSMASIFSSNSILGMGVTSSSILSAASSCDRAIA
jgi:hypothetical protein